MPTYIAPGVYIEEILSGIHPIEGVSTSTAAFIGGAARGSTDAAVDVRSVSDFVCEFGPIDAGGVLGTAVRQFFDNGGTEAWVVRLADDSGAVLTPDTEPFERQLIPASGRGGVFHLDRVPIVNLLCVPGVTTPGVIAALEAFCLARRIFLIADGPPRGAAAPDPCVTGDAARNAAMYVPWLTVVDPATGATRSFPPGGFVAGVYARTDQTRGVWKAPAGLGATLSGATGVTDTLTEDDMLALTEHGVNAIRRVSGPGLVVWGSRTLAGASGSGSEWRYVPVRRLALFVEGSLSRSLTWAQFEPNAPSLWARIRLTVNTFMMGLFRAGAFVGATPTSCYYVKCGDDTTTQNDLDHGVLTLEVGFAPVRPAEFVVLRIPLRAESKPL